MPGEHKSTYKPFYYDYGEANAPSPSPMSRLSQQEKWIDWRASTYTPENLKEIYKGIKSAYEALGEFVDEHGHFNETQQESIARLVLFTLYIF